MRHVIGVDEAGYGPNLGPLVIAASRWSVPADCDAAAMTELLASAVCSDPKDARDGRLLVADSKTVHQASQGIERLETAALSLLAAAGRTADSFRELVGRLAGDGAIEELAGIPWFADSDVPLPVAADGDAIRKHAERLTAACRDVGVACEHLAADVVPAARFNGDLDGTDSKGLVLSRCSLRLLRRLWEPATQTPTLVVCDKHGGRNRYDELLFEVADEEWVFRIRESTEISEYRVAQTRLWFRVKAEAFLPVAVASIVAKYLRELAMIAFNAFWQTHQPDLKPTKGYPVDAARFRESVRETQQRLGIADAILWRRR